MRHMVIEQDASFKFTYVVAMGLQNAYGADALADGFSISHGTCLARGFVKKLGELLIIESKIK